MKRDSNTWKRDRKFFMRIMADHCFKDREFEKRKGYEVRRPEFYQEIMRVFGEFLDYRIAGLTSLIYDPIFILVLRDYVGFLFLKDIATENIDISERNQRIFDMYWAMRSAAGKAFLCPVNIIQAQNLSKERRIRHA